MPLPILRELNIKSPLIISKMCKTSLQSATYTADCVHTHEKYPELLEQMSGYIHQNKEVMAYFEMAAQKLQPVYQ